MGTTPQQPYDRVVGRASELEAIGRALEQVASGTPDALQLIGEPGIGKSTLLAELGRAAGGRGYLVLDGRAAEFEHDIPLGLIVDALNDYAGTLEPALLRALDDDAVAELASVLPSLARLAPADVPSRAVGEPPRAVGEPSRAVGEPPRAAGERYRIHYAIRTLLERLAQRQPVLLSLDDAHWADQASFEVIAHLLRRFRGPLLVALAFRQVPPRLAAALEGAEREGCCTRLELRPLTAEEANALIDPGLDATARALLFKESGGNPFYLEQLARVSAAGGRAALPAPVGVPASALPAAVIAAIDDELQRLPGETRRVLDAAAVAGESFDPELVGPIAELEATAALATFDELLAADLIRPTLAPRRFRFRHPIVRRAVYDEMPPGWRVGAHARAAAALSALGAPASELAHHVERSATPGDEDAIALLAGTARLVARRAPATAGRWLLAAIGLLPPDGDGERRAALLGEAGSALTSAGAYEESLTALEEALSLVPHDQAERRAELVARLAYAKRRSGRPFDTRPWLEDALESLTRPDSPAGLNVRIELAIDEFWRDEFEPMRDLAGGLMEVARERSDLPMVSLAGALRSLANSSQCQTADAVADLVEAQAAYAAIPDAQLAERIYISFYIGVAALRLERAADALADVNRGLDVARATGQGATVTPWSAIAAAALLLLGRVGEAASVSASAIEASALSADDWRTIWALEVDALAAFWAGNAERTLASSREMVGRSQRLHRFLAGPGRIQLAGALMAAGDAAGAMAELSALDAEPTWRLLDLHAAHGWDLLTRAQLALGDVEAAAATAARAVARAEAAGLWQQLATARCCRAAALVAGEDFAGAVSFARDAVDVAEPAANPLLSGRCGAQLGVALAGSGERERGIAELERAERALLTCGAVREADAAARELRRLGRRVPRRARPDGARGLPALSPREREIAGHVAAGETNRAIAALLFLSEKTVESHLARVYSKLGVHSRAALTAVVVREGEGVLRGGG